MWSMRLVVILRSQRAKAAIKRSFYKKKKYIQLREVYIVELTQDLLLISLFSLVAVEL